MSSPILPGTRLALLQMCRYTSFVVQSCLSAPLAPSIAGWDSDKCLFLPLSFTGSLFAVPFVSIQLMLLRIGSFLSFSSRLCHICWTANFASGLMPSTDVLFMFPTASQRPPVQMSSRPVNPDSYSVFLWTYNAVMGGITGHNHCPQCTGSEETQCDGPVLKSLVSSKVLRRTKTEGKSVKLNIFLTF